MGWLFKVEEKDEDAELAKWLEFDTKIRDIKRRIAKLRKDLHQPRRGRMADPQEVDEAPRIIRQVENKEAERNRELDLIKAKLMGGKK